MDEARTTITRSLFLLLLASIAWAHVGSPDVYFEGSAGPYPLFITIRPPVVIPGVAQIEIRSSTAGVQKMLITPVPLAGEGSEHAPTPDVMVVSKQDPQFFTGSVWIMRTGSWQVRIEADGTRGTGELSVPVPAVASRTKGMDLTLGALLFALMLILIVDS